MFSEKDIARFWTRVRQGEGCWEWQGTVHSAGYGVLRGPNGKQWKAHRAAFFLTHGTLPGPGRYVCHRCDNRLCVRPDHLYDGDAVDNNRDTVERHRRAPAPTHCRNGHEFTPENTLPAFKSAGVVWGRRCRVCTYRTNNASYARRHSTESR